MSVVWMILIVSVVIGVILLPILYISSGRKKKSLKLIYEALGVRFRLNDVWDSADFHDTALRSSRYNNLSGSVDCQERYDAEDHKRRVAKILKGSTVEEFSISVNEINWDIIIWTSEISHSGLVRNINARTGHEGSFLIFSCQTVDAKLPKSVKELLPDLLSCFEKTSQ